MTWVLEIAMQEKNHVLVRSTNEIGLNALVLMIVGVLKIGAM